MFVIFLFSYNSSHQRQSRTQAYPVCDYEKLLFTGQVTTDSSETLECPLFSPRYITASDSPPTSNT